MCRSETAAHQPQLYDDIILYSYSCVCVCVCVCVCLTCREDLDSGEAAEERLGGVTDDSKVNEHEDSNGH